MSSRNDYQLRAVIRQLISEHLQPVPASGREPSQGQAPPVTGSFGADSQRHDPSSSPQPVAFGPESQVVSITTDDELAAFVFTILRLAANPKRRDDLLAGRLSFRLARGSPSARPGQHQPSSATRIETGALTERTVRAAADTATTFVVARGVSVTPLAAETAHRLGMTIEREK